MGQPPSFHDMGLQKNQKNAILPLLAIFSQISTEPLNSKSDAVGRAH